MFIYEGNVEKISGSLRSRVFPSAITSFKLFEFSPSSLSPIGKKFNHMFLDIILRGFRGLQTQEFLKKNLERLSKNVLKNESYGPINHEKFRRLAPGYFLSALSYVNHRKTFCGVQLNAGDHS